MACKGGKGKGGKKRKVAVKENNFIRSKRLYE